MKSKNKKELKAELIYKKYLKDIYNLIGDRTTYLNQILGAGRKLFGVKFKGVFPSDKIPKLNDLSPYCILNLDKSSESGSHWVALSKIPNTNDSILYDSFGRNYKKIIPALNYSGNGRIINSDFDAEQKILETDCGARCLAFLMVIDNYGVNVAKLI